MKYWLRMGGPNAITWQAWLILSPISIFFTWVVLPEGYAPTANILNGFLVGLITHLVTGLVLLVAKYTVLQGSNIRPRPVLTLMAFALAGTARGWSAAYFLEALGVTEKADYGQRMVAGSILVLIWFAVAAVLVDGEKKYRSTYSDLVEKLQRQISLRTEQKEVLENNQQRLLREIRQTLEDALRSGKSTTDINNSVDQLIRPLAHRMSITSRFALTSAQPPKRRVQLGPVIRTAFSKTPYNPLWTSLMAVLATLYSRLWQFGLVALIDSLFTLFSIWAIFTLANRFKLYGIWVIPVWFFTGLLAASGTAILSGRFSLEGLPNTLYLSINVVIPAAIIAAIGAFDRNSEYNLTLLREVTDQVEWEASSLEQRAWVEQQRLARFVHSELQSRLRAFALKLELAGRAPSDEEIESLRQECERAFPLQSEQKKFQDFLANAQELWEGAVQIEADVSEEALMALAADSYASAATEEICREAIVNAVKHGKAKIIELTLQVIDSTASQLTLNLKIVDDGFGIESIKTGMGLAEIEKLSIDYSLTRDGGKTVLSAAIACLPNLVLQD